MNEDVQQALGAIGEPNRFRIVELLSSRPYSVGELAEALGALQPQTTKHLQTLEAAEVVEIHRLGRRRVARLRRETLQMLSRYFGGLVTAGPDDVALQGYQRAVEREESAALSAAHPRTYRFSRTVNADVATVLDAWTRPELAMKWWAPRHFRVEAFDLMAEPGTPIRIVLGEGGGARYESRGELIALTSRSLTFSLAPLDTEGRPLFAAHHVLSLSGDGPVDLSLVVEVSGIRPDAAPAIAGLEPGWSQLLDALEEQLRAGPEPAR